jgi:hypothetical protein
MQIVSLRPTGRRRLPRPAHLVAALALSTACVGGAAACGSAPDDTEDTETAAATGADSTPAPATVAPEPTSRADEAAQELRSGLRILAQGLQDAVTDVDPVAYERLMEVLPEAPGWTRSDHRGERAALPVPYASAYALYERDGQRISAEITDTALSQLLLSPFAMFLGAGFEERTADGFTRATTVAGAPAFEDWNAPDRRGEVVVVVGDRFLVKLTGTNVSDVETVTSLASRLRLTRLAELR